MPLPDLRKKKPQLPTRRAVPWWIETFQLLHIAGVGCQEPRQSFGQS